MYAIKLVACNFLYETIVVFKTNSDFEFVLNSLKLFKTTLFKTATVHSSKYYSTPSSQVLGVDHQSIWFKALRARQQGQAR